ncbi:DUF4328 domain-containing protein [Nonomuraea sp. NPDC050536]|uniref:DUF4328 domain-containing protein n=1 Tax=Nonomuraea sp. NPDC050536 TaxID=3364366 RepID=UPI0037CBB3DC
MRFAQTPPTKAASAVYLTLSAQVLSLGALVIFEYVRGGRLAHQLAAYGGRPHGADAQAVVGAVTVFAVLMMLLVGTTIATACAYLTWLARARQANTRSAPAGPVVAAWLVPGVNLVAPVALVDEVWRGARPPFDRRNRWLALLGAWWLAWLGMLALFLVKLPLETDKLTLTGVGPLEFAVAALAAGLCATTVREITRIQQSSLGVLLPRTAGRPTATRRTWRRSVQGNATEPGAGLGSVTTPL